MSFFGKKKDPEHVTPVGHVPTSRDSDGKDWMGRKIRADGTVEGEPRKITNADKAPITQRGSVHCSICSGVGTLYNGKMPCTRCNGTGIITAEMWARGIR